MKAKLISYDPFNRYDSFGFVTIRNLWVIVPVRRVGSSYFRFYNESSAVKNFGLAIGC